MHGKFLASFLLSSDARKTLPRGKEGTEGLLPSQGILGRLRDHLEGLERKNREKEETSSAHTVQGYGEYGTSPLPTSRAITAP